MSDEQAQDTAPVDAVVIQPFPPRDGNEWECQCARCGSSADWRECGECEDGYREEDFGDDVVSDMDFVKCEFCEGHGGDYWCRSPKEWCEANPVDGREKIERGQIEWFRVREAG